jgi:N-acetyl-1-D-myo-inositol-2-amino-2-deoxy-alpha-D-glucopyranoside deacetylase
MTQKPTLVAIFAHPDDEAFGTGGTLAKYAAEGADVHLITTTLGEAGEIANPAVTLTQPLGVLREQELRRACACYGIKQLHLLGYMDGQTTIVSQSEAVFKIVKLLRQLKPQVVIGFGPEGIYGHYDHLAAHRWTTAAVQIAARPDWWPEAGPPHTVAKFYHRAMFEEQIALVEKMNGQSYVCIEGIPFPFTGYPPEKITTVIDITAHAHTKLNGIRCHASQVSADNPYLQPDFDPSEHPWFATEAYILAQHNPKISLPANGQKETDLFSGLR